MRVQLVQENMLSYKRVLKLSKQNAPAGKIQLDNKHIFKNTHTHINLHKVKLLNIKHIQEITS